MAEMWKSVPEFEGHYEVSDFGRVRSIDRLTYDGQRRKGRILRDGITAGYRRVVLCASRKRVNRLVHRLVLTAFVGECPSGKEACHNNGDALDCRLSNLRWGTKAENSKDVRKHGNLVGVKNPAAKLTPNDVRTIRVLRAKGNTYKSIGVLFGVTNTAVRFIDLGRTWGHVQ